LPEMDCFSAGLQGSFCPIPLTENFHRSLVLDASGKIFAVAGDWISVACLPCQNLMQ